MHNSGAFYYSPVKTHVWEEILFILISFSFEKETIGFEYVIEIISTSQDFMTVFLDWYVLYYLWILPLK